MKTYKKALGQAAWSAMVSGALLLGAASASAQGSSPVGVTWDALINGNQGVGLGYITFNSDFTFSGLSIIRPPFVVPTAPGTYDPEARNVGGDVGRGTLTDADRTSLGGGDSGTGGGTVTPVNTNSFGFASFYGEWNYDPYGKIVGYMTQVVGLGTNAPSTNVFPVKAIVVPGVRLTLATYGAGGAKTLYTGIPMRDTLPDLAGDWYGVETFMGTRSVEFFNVAPSYQLNAYNSIGSGASYGTAGWIILSSRGRIGIAFQTGSIERTTIGTFRSATRLAMTSGYLEPKLPVRFNAYHYPVPVN